MSGGPDFLLLPPLRATILIPDLEAQRKDLNVIISAKFGSNHTGFSLFFSKPHQETLTASNLLNLIHSQLIKVIKMKIDVAQKKTQQPCAVPNINLDKRFM